MSYDFNSALRRRLQSIQDYTPLPTTTLAKLQQQKTVSTPQASNSTSSGNASFDAFKAAISGQESGGNYSSRNSSTGAMGKYQIMPSNLGGAKSGWDYEALGYDISANQFMANPQLQEQIASFKLKQYYDKWGPAGAAVAWYAGPGAVAKNMNSTKTQGAYPSINSYKNSILKRMEQL